MMNEDLRECVKLAERAVGGTAALAKAIGITSQAISQWPKIPAERVPQVSDVTGLPPHLLRPDLYRRPAVNHAAQEGRA